MPSKVNTKKNTKKKYFIKHNNQIMVVYKDFFDSLRDRDEVLSLAVQIYIELNATMLEDSKDDYGDSYIGNMKIVTGLTRSLDEFRKRFPGIMEQIHFMPLVFEGQRIFKS